MAHQSRRPPRIRHPWRQALNRSPYSASNPSSFDQLQLHACHRFSSKSYRWQSLYKYHLSPCCLRSATFQMHVRTFSVQCQALRLLKFRQYLQSSSHEPLHRYTRRRCEWQTVHVCKWCKATPKPANSNACGYEETNKAKQQHAELLIHTSTLALLTSRRSLHTYTLPAQATRYSSTAVLCDQTALTVGFLVQVQ